MNLSIEVQPIPGSHIGNAFAEACALARRLGLAWVTFEFNGLHCTAYPDDRGFAYGDGVHLRGTWIPEKGYHEQPRN